MLADIVSSISHSPESTSRDCELEESMTCESVREFSSKRLVPQRDPFLPNDDIVSKYGSHRARDYNSETGEILRRRQPGSSALPKGTKPETLSLTFSGHTGNKELGYNRVIYICEKCWNDDLVAIEDESCDEHKSWPYAGPGKSTPVNATEVWPPRFRISGPLENVSQSTKIVHSGSASKTSTNSNKGEAYLKVRPYKKNGVSRSLPQIEICDDELAELSDFIPATSVEERTSGLWRSKVMRNLLDARETARLETMPKDQAERSNDGTALVEKKGKKVDGRSLAATVEDCVDENTG